MSGTYLCRGGRIQCHFTCDCPDAAFHAKQETCGRAVIEMKSMEIQIMQGGKEGFPKSLYSAKITLMFHWGMESGQIHTS